MDDDEALRPGGASKRAGGFPLGEVARRRRLELGYTQAELADRAGISQAMVSDIERGRVRLPDNPLRTRLAEALRMTHLELVVASGVIEAKEVAADYRPVVGDYQRKLDRLPPEARRRVEAMIDDTLRAHGLDPEAT